jgi:hypothetical protein
MLKGNRRHGQGSVNFTLFFLNFHEFTCGDFFIIVLERIVFFVLEQRVNIKIDILMKLIFNENTEI